MLPIELLSERFPDRFKLRWPADNSVIEIESRLKDEVLYCRPQNAASEVIWMCAMDKNLNSQKNSVSALATAIRQKKIWRCCLFQGQPLFVNHREGIIPRESDSMGAAFHLPQLQFPRYFEAPTMHQKLEAMLLWREFLAGKISEKEIEHYLSPEQSQT